MRMIGIPEVRSREDVPHRECCEIFSQKNMFERPPLQASDFAAVSTQHETKKLRMCSTVEVKRIRSGKCSDNDRIDVIMVGGERLELPTLGV